MIVIEMRDAKEKAFELLDEIKELGRDKKMLLCELEDTLYDCFDEHEEKESEGSDEGKDLAYKTKYEHRYAMRNFDYEDEDHPYYRRSMRMRSRMRR